MDRLGFEASVIVGITGAQGVGKSTFSRALRDALPAFCDTKIDLIDGLGQSVRELGIPVGSDSSAKSIAAIYIAHLRRQRLAPNGIIILDRCAVDALAYVQCLNITSPVVTALYREVSALMLKELDLAVHLEMTGIFEEKKQIMKVLSCATAYQSRYRE